MHYVILGIACGGVEKVLVRERHYNWGVFLSVFTQDKTRARYLPLRALTNALPKGGGAESRQ